MCLTLKSPEKRDRLWSGIPEDLQSRVNAYFMRMTLQLHSPSYKQKDDQANPSSTKVDSLLGEFIQWAAVLGSGNELGVGSDFDEIMNAGGSDEQPRRSLRFVQIEETEDPATGRRERRSDRGWRSMQTVGTCPQRMRARRQATTATLSSRRGPR